MITFGCTRVCMSLRTHCSCALCKALEGDAGPYTFMPFAGPATPCTHECVWTCVTLYLTRPFTVHRAQCVFMCTARGNDYPMFNLLD